MQLEFVAVPRPVPYLGEITMGKDGRLVGVPDSAKQMVLPIGSVSVYYGIPLDELRESWIVAAIKDEHADAGHIHNWGVCYDEWLDVLAKHPEIRPEAMKHVFPVDNFTAPHNHPDIQDPLRAEWIARRGTVATSSPAATVAAKTALWKDAWSNCTVLAPSN